VPIFSPIDEFRPATEGTLADYNWADKGSSYRSVLGILPYDGLAGKTGPRASIC